MKKYQVTYAVTKFEVWEVIADNEKMAKENFDLGTLVKDGEEDGNVQEVKEIK